MSDTLIFALLLAAGTGFSLINGMNDISGLVAPVVATRALSVTAARLVAICGIWLGIMFAQDTVARTVAIGIAKLTSVDIPHDIALLAWFGGVAGALSWGIVARRIGTPTSATHAFIGALCGATLAATGRASYVYWGIGAFVHTPHRIVGVMKVFGGLVLSPLIGSAVGFLLFRALVIVLVRATAHVVVELRRVQCGALLMQAFCYGANDAQNIMGAVAGAMMSAAWMHQNAFHLPIWLKLCNSVVLSLGTLIGSGNIVRTVGGGLIQLTVPEAACGQIAEAVAVLGAAHAGAPVSSSQVLSSALVGAGGATRPRHVRWQRVREILMAWGLTFPCALIFGAMLTLLCKFTLEVCRAV